MISIGAPFLGGHARLQEEEEKTQDREAISRETPFRKVYTVEERHLKEKGS